ncbi:asparagine--tRNA ligase [Anaeromyxobacter diazotrophicus]|uniref:Asparagine--tRNA ligase n=1 Tax=Anaeromyxobacter diazotrophicus TaxID=2590199 RepID=A0A7I9VJ58_9BACT|nr:asparagine--tRNA ligase [Anaeromyxobacter diazotrophicus]GEJ56188.1 asparagine--tRNA ligase [Anaeromyxobacter diazotrophicus]
MFPPVYIADIAAHEGQEVTLHGWLHNRRSSGKLHFLQVRDGTGVIQCVVFKGNVTPEVFQEADHLPQETSLAVTGLVKKDARSPIGFELDVKDLRALAKPAREFPLGHKEHGVAFLMEQRHNWLRSQRQAVILRVRHSVVKAIRDFFDGRGFTLVDAPVFTPSACEGTSTLFEVPYFDLGKAYLTQSGQLYMEAAAMALGKVYCFGPTFRAEKSKTRRHLTEFWMVEPEVAFMDLDGDMELMEQLVAHVVQAVLAKHERELRDVLERDVSKLANVKAPFPRITYTEAVEVIQKAGHPMKWGDDIGGDEETVVASAYDRPVMVHRYPAAMKAFYFKKDPQDANVALGCDVLAPEGYGEIIGGGQREDDLAVLEASIAQAGLPKEAFEWYLDVRRYGSVPHAGFGMGVERCVAWICGLHHVRETIPFPRMMERITP